MSDVCFIQLDRWRSAIEDGRTKFDKYSDVITDVTTNEIAVLLRFNFGKYIHSGLPSDVVDPQVVEEVWYELTSVTRFQPRRGRPLRGVLEGGEPDGGHYIMFSKEADSTGNRRWFMQDSLKTRPLVYNVTP